MCINIKSCKKTPTVCLFVQITETPERVISEETGRNSARVAVLVGEEAIHYC